MHETVDHEIFSGYTGAVFSALSHGNGPVKETSVHIDNAAVEYGELIPAYVQKAVTVTQFKHGKVSAADTAAYKALTELELEIFLRRIFKRAEAVQKDPVKIQVGHTKMNVIEYFRLCKRIFCKNLLNPEILDYAVFGIIAQGAQLPEVGLKIQK